MLLQQSQLFDMRLQLLKPPPAAQEGVAVEHRRDSEDTPLKAHFPVNHVGELQEQAELFHRQDVACVHPEKQEGALGVTGAQLHS